MTSRQGPDPSAQHRPLEDPTGRVLEGAVPVVVLLSADWAGPSRPAPTLLQELTRRWGAAMHTILLEDPGDEILDRWEVTHLPTWLRFVPAEAAHVSSDTGALREETLHGQSPGGAELTLPGPWVLTHRRSGGLPKHVVESEFGPDADS